jgi:hypothetical protein
MQIFIKSLTEKTIILDVNSYDTIKDIKIKLEYIEGIPSDKQTFIFANKKLLDDKTLSDYNIQESSTIKSIGLLKGGYFI